MEEVMKAGQGMRDLARYMDIDTGLRDGVAQGKSSWYLLFVVIFVFTALIIVLRVAVKRVADQKTRRMILESMADDDAPSPPPAADAPSPPPAADARGSAPDNEPDAR